MLETKLTAKVHTEAIKHPFEPCRVPYDPLNRVEFNKFAGEVEKTRTQSSQTLGISHGVFWEFLVIPGVIYSRPGHDTEYYVDERFKHFVAYEVLHSCPPMG